MALKKSIPLHLCKKMVEASLTNEVNHACRYFLFQDKVPKKVREKFYQESKPNLLTLPKFTKST